MSLGFTFNAYVKNSLVLTQEQFNTVINIAAIGEGLIPVPQQRPPLLPKNPVEDTDELHALFVDQYNTFWYFGSEAFQDYFPIEI